MGEGFPLAILGVVCLVSVIVYVAFMIFLPEWVGITGKTALKNEESHREGSLEIDRRHTMHTGAQQAEDGAGSGVDAGGASSSTGGASSSTVGARGRAEDEP